MHLPLNTPEPTMPTAYSFPVHVERALRDLATGHLAIYRAASGSDHADRVVTGGEATWQTLADHGLITPPDTGLGPWTLTDTGRAVAADRGW